MNIPPRHLKPIQRIDREQRDFIFDRLREIKELPRFAEVRWRDRGPRMTAAERNAKKVISAMERRFSRDDNQRRKAVKKIETAVEREMLFGSMEKALAIIDKVLRG